MIVRQSLKSLTAKVKLEAVRFPMAHRLGGSGAPEVREDLLSSCLLIQKKIFILMQCFNTCGNDMEDAGLAGLLVTNLVS